MARTQLFIQTFHMESLIRDVIPSKVRSLMSLRLLRLLSCRPLSSPRHLRPPRTEPGLPVQENQGAKNLVLPWLRISLLPLKANPGPGYMWRVVNGESNRFFRKFHSSVRTVARGNCVAMVRNPFVIPVGTDRETKSALTTPSLIVGVVTRFLVPGNGWSAILIKRITLRVDGDGGTQPIQSNHRVDILQTIRRFQNFSFLPLRFRLNQVTNSRHLSIIYSRLCTFYRH
jgi:hypothetical protein